MPKKYEIEYSHKEEIESLKEQFHHHLEECRGVKVIKNMKKNYETTLKNIMKGKKMSNVMSKISKHKWKLAIIIAETLLWMAAAYGRYLFLKFGKTPEADLIIELTGIANIGLAMLSAYVFGNKTELDDKIGLVQTLELKNQMQHFIITEKGLNDPGFHDPNIKK